MVAQVGEPPTASADETSSQPSTSTASEAMKEVEPDKEQSSDSDASIGWGDYEHRKDVIVKRLVLCDQLLARMKITAKHTRLKDYEKRKVHISNRTDPEYLERVAAMEKEVQKEQDKLLTALDLELASLERVNEGEKDFIARGYRDRQQYKQSMARYDSKRKIDAVLKRLWKEDEVRADLRIFVGQDVPDEWLDEFIKSYIDELEERENSEDAVRERNRQRYRKEAGESLDDGRPLWYYLDRAQEALYAHPSDLKRAPRALYEEQERLEREREERIERQKMVEERINYVNDSNVGRYFPSISNRESVRLERINDDLVMKEDVFSESPMKKKKLKKMTIDEMMTRRNALKKKLGVKERKPVVITIDDDGPAVREIPRRIAAPIKSKRKVRRKTLQELRMMREMEKKIRERKIETAREKRKKMLDQRKEELRKLEDKRQALLRQKLRLEKKEETESEEEKLDLETTVRQGVRAVLKTYKNGHSIQSKPSKNGEKRVGRLKKALKSLLEMKRGKREDPDVQRARRLLLEKFDLNEKLVKNLQQKREKNKKKAKRLARVDAGEVPIEEQARNSALVDALVSKSLKVPMMGSAWMDEGGRARKAVEAVRQKTRQASTRLAIAKEEQFERRKKPSADSESDWEDDKKNGKKSKRKEIRLIKRKESGESEIVIVEVEGGNGKKPNGRALTSKERREKNRKMREIRAVIQGKDLKKSNHSSSNGRDSEIEIIKVVNLKEATKKEKKNEVNGKVKEEPKRRNGRRRKFKRDEHEWYGSDNAEEDDYGSRKKKYGSGVPGYRLAPRAPQKPRLNPQLSEDRILQDLYRAGALRQRETYGEYIERIDRERRQRALSYLNSEEAEDERLALLSPRSQLAFKEFPFKAADNLTSRQRRALLDELPSTSKDWLKESDEEEEEGHSNESDDEDEEEEEEEELSEGWELEDEEEYKERKERAKRQKAAAAVVKEVKEECDDHDVDLMEMDDYRFDDDDMDEMEEEELKEESEDARIEEMEEFSPRGNEAASPLLEQSSTKKKSTHRLNGFSRTGKATVA